VDVFLRNARVVFFMKTGVRTCEVFRLRRFDCEWDDFFWGLRVAPAVLRSKSGNAARLSFVSDEDVMTRYAEGVA